MKVLAIMAVMLPMFGMAWVLARAVGRHQQRQLEANWRPSGDLATAVRLLDRVAEADEMMPYLPSETRAEVQAFLDNYHAKGIGQ